MFLILLISFLSILWIAGGASFADVPGQIVVRVGAWALLIVGILLGKPPSVGTARPVFVLLLAATALALAQLVPLPPGAWQALPGHAPLAEAAAASGQAQPWRPWSMVPGATLNAAFSLIVPILVLLLAANLRDGEWRWLPGVLLGLVAASMLIGLLQFSGGGFNHPLINDTPGDVSGSFANRNHFALFLAIGCVLAPTWAFARDSGRGWRGPAALGLVLLFELMILASGSRSGLLLGGIGLFVGPLVVSREIRREFRRYPRWLFPALAAALIAIFISISVAAGRAVSIDRAFAIDPGQDMRARGLPTVLAMIHDYFPWGSGLGGFDPIFRMHEPYSLLDVTYFNHAHNDFLEIALDTGLPGMLLVVCAVLWWAWASIAVWRAGGRDPTARAGSAILFLVIVASATDYPARTPMMMATVVIAALWLCRRANAGPALPPRYPDL